MTIAALISRAPVFQPLVEVDYATLTLSENDARFAVPDMDKIFGETGYASAQLWAWGQGIVIGFPAATRIRKITLDAETQDIDGAIGVWVGRTFGERLATVPPGPRSTAMFNGDFTAMQLVIGEHIRSIIHRIRIWS